MKANVQTIKAPKVQKSVVLERAHYLVNTSVQDMQSGLWQYNTRADLRILGAALAISKRRKETTKVKILERKIKNLRKAVGAL